MYCQLSDLLEAFFLPVILDKVIEGYSDYVRILLLESETAWNYLRLLNCYLPTQVGLDVSVIRLACRVANSRCAEDILNEVMSIIIKGTSIRKEGEGSKIL